MSNKRNFFRDRFTFGLRGMTATASFFITPVLADDRINKAWDEKLSRAETSTEESVTDQDVPPAPLGQSWSQTTG